MGDDPAREETLVLRALRPLLPPPPGSMSPTAWGSEEHVRALFGDRDASLEMTRNEYTETAATPRAYLELFKATFGPAVAIYASLADRSDRLAAWTGNSSSSPSARSGLRRAGRPSSPTGSCS